MPSAPQEIAKTWTGTRTVEEMTGRTLAGTPIPFGPYTRAQVIALAVGVLTTLFVSGWALDSGYGLVVTLASIVATAAAVVALKFVPEEGAGPIALAVIFAGRWVRRPALTHRLSAGESPRPMKVGGNTVVILAAGTADRHQ
ncbi:hypothetical protein [Tsukamurella hominis]|uniref:hypothetical protein n=1 Tax=Tsukamurella hominis TaxID=1970232 RepID=UPI0039E73C52